MPLLAAATLVGAVWAVGAAPGGTSSTGTVLGTGAGGDTGVTAPAQVGFTNPAARTRNRSTCGARSTGPCPQANTVWSGYTIVEPLGRQITTVSASWVQTKAKCSRGSDAWSLFWVGLDGAANADNNHSVEQGGTSAQCEGGGSPVYEAWWEIYPANDVETTFPVAVGDHISASVVYSDSDNTITITVDDTTSNNSLVAVVSDSAAADPDTYTLTVNGNTSGPDAFQSTLCGPSDPNGPCGTSAEWVVEAPSGAPGGLYPLAHFRPITFESAQATDAEGNQGSIASPDWNTSALDLTSQAGLLLARVSGLDQKGTSFTDRWVHK